MRKRVVPHERGDEYGSKDTGAAAGHATAVLRLRDVRDILQDALPEVGWLVGWLKDQLIVLGGHCCCCCSHDVCSTDVAPGLGSSKFSSVMLSFPYFYTSCPALT